MARLINGYPFDSADFSPSGEMPLVRIRDILATNFETFVPRENVPPFATLRDDDVVIGMDGDFNVVLWDRGVAALNQRVCLLRTGGRADPRFLAYVLPRHLRVINDLTYSTTVKHLSGWQVLHIKCEAPDVEEQRAIADYLDHETAQVDALVAKQEELIRLLQERRKAFVDREFQRTENKQRATVRQTLERVQRVPQPGAGVVTAYRDGIVTLRANRRTDGYTMSEAEAGYQRVDPGDLVFHALDGFAGAVGISDSTGQCSPVYHVCRPQYDDDAEYLSLLIRYLGTSGFLSTQAPSTRQRSVDFRNWATFARVPLMLPPVNEQKTFVAKFRERTARVDALIGKAEEHIALAKERRAALITAAVTGQIDVRAVAQKAS